ncbi:MAG: choice-of-anchor P family protein [Candidatus Sulfotelmatobacter sp.]
MAASKRVHYFHADASAFGGYFERPIEHTIAPQAPMSLSPSGGYGSARSENFRLEGVVSYKSASTQVSGRLSKKEGHGWVTLATATVEGLNVLDVVTADRLTAQVSTEHPLEGDNPRVTFLGTSFDNLKIAGCPIDIKLNFNICDQGNGNGYPSEPCIEDDQFLARVADQYKRMTNAKNLPEWVKDRSIPDWIKERYEWDSEQSENAGSVLCAIVNEAAVREGCDQFPGRPFGSVFEVPDFGRVFLGELFVDCNSYRLTTIRLEMGCSGEGSVSGPTAMTNGHTIPP